MSYVDGFVTPVPGASREAYRQHAEKVGALFKEHGATGVVECWGDDVPEGKVTSFPMAVKCEPGEVVVFSWVTWPSRAARDDGWKKLMADPRMAPGAMPMPFDGKRLIYGGFEVLLQV
ncbi:MAG: DUF1428 domain-containing protein [Burkholderiales bacterium]|nr:DUF1428 domain-containing protein [Burkholderiales bacterium]MDE2627304.1 DUF1428 domain-containing protein [Burkholderiales bacterium]